MAHPPEIETRTEIRDGMRITWHQPVPMDDGIVLRADVYRPIAEGRYPVILSHGIYWHREDGSRTCSCRSSR